MARRRNTAPPTTYVQLPLISTLAIYARVATSDPLTQGVNGQVEALRQYAATLGFYDEQISVFCDEGTAAAAPLLERQGYVSLLWAIGEQAVQVLLIQKEDRIFTNATEPQVNVFISLCIDSKIIIITPTMVYDLQDLSHIALFRYHFVTAYQVIEDGLKVKAG